MEAVSENPSQLIYTNTDRQMGSKKSAVVSQEDNIIDHDLHNLNSPIEIEKGLVGRQSRPISRKKSSSKPRFRSGSHDEVVDIYEDHEQTQELKDEIVEIRTELARLKQSVQPLNTFVELACEF